jgi:hypothetical protein
MITGQTREGWKFLFLAAGQDAIKTGGDLGISANNSMSWSSNKMSSKAVFASVSSNMSSYRSSKFGGASFDNIEQELGFSDKQRDDSK